MKVHHNDMMGRLIRTIDTSEAHTNIEIEDNMGNLWRVELAKDGGLSLHVDGRVGIFPVVSNAIELAVMER